MDEAVLLEIESHILGKNAMVRVYPDRVEWERGKSISGAKVAAGVMTAGMSMLATGARTRKGAGTEMIPVRSISSVTTKRDSMRNDIVTIVTTGNTIDLRCSKSEAAELRNLLVQLINGSHPSQGQQAAAPAVQAVPTPPPPPQGPPPGWYPDAQAPGMVRWWDGTQWTEHLQPQQ